MKQTIIFDLDNTLINTERIKTVLIKTAIDFGFSETQAWDIYNKSHRDGGKVTFTLERFAEVLIEMGVEKNVVGIIESIKEKFVSDSLLLPGAKDLLNFCQKNNIKKYLISLGVKKWQDEKIVLAGLDKIFKSQEIIFREEIKTKEGKVEAIKRIFGDEFTGQNMIFVNDKPNENRDVLESLPNIKVLGGWCRQDRRYSESDFIKLKEDFGDRFEWSDNLVDLKNKLEKICL